MKVREPYLSDYDKAQYSRGHSHAMFKSFIIYTLLFCLGIYLFFDKLTCV